MSCNIVLLERISPKTTILSTYKPFPENHDLFLNSVHYFEDIVQTDNTDILKKYMPPTINLIMFEYF